MDTQLGRIFRDGVASDGTGSKIYPGEDNNVNTYFYETFQLFNSGPEEAVSINATVSSPNTHFSVFLGTTYDEIFANNGANYLGDIGASISQAFSILAPANSAFLVVASTNFVGDATGSFSFTVRGDNVSAAVPEPGTIALFGLGLIGLSFTRRKKA